MDYLQIFKKHLELSLTKKDYFLVHDENIRYHLNRIKELNNETFLDAISLQSDEKYSGYRNQTFDCFIGLNMFNMNYNNLYEEIRIVRANNVQIIIERHLCIPLLYYHRNNVLKNLNLSDALKDYSFYRFIINDKISEYIFPLIKKGYVLKTDNTFELSDGCLNLSIHNIFGMIKIITKEFNMIIQKPLEGNVSIRQSPFETERLKKLAYIIQFGNGIVIKHNITKVNTNPFLNAILNCLLRSEPVRGGFAALAEGYSENSFEERIKRIYKPLQRPSLVSMKKKKLTQYAVLPSVFFLVTFTINSIMFIVLLVFVVRAQYKL